MRKSNYKTYNKIVGSHLKFIEDRLKSIFPLKEEIDDGIYTFEDHLPRILLSYNKIKIIELLKKIEKK